MQRLTPDSKSRIVYIFSSIVLIALGGFLLTMPRSVSAASTFTVNSTADSVDAVPGDGICADSSNRCTLRAAVMEANALAGADTIVVPAGNYVLTRGPYDDEFNFDGAEEGTGDLDVLNGDLTITGAGPGATVIDGNGIDRIFDVNNFSAFGPAVNLTLQGLTLTNGHAPLTPDGYEEPGGAIQFDGTDNNTGVPTGTLTINNCQVTTNTASGVGGGVLVIFGSLNVNGSQISGNISQNASGGGILYDGGAAGGSRTLQVTNSTISGNKALNGTFGSGGGMWAGGNANFTIENNKFLNNQAGADGGGISSSGSAKAINKNSFENNSAKRGGGIYNTGGSLTFTDNVVVNNTASAVGTSSGMFNFGTATVSNNWWGCNAGPGFSPCDRASGIVPGFPWLTLSHTATPSTIAVGGTSTLQADFFTNSAGAIIAPVDLVALNGRTATFNNAVKGTVSPATAQILNGKANSTFTANGSSGAGSADATVDHETKTAQINIEAPPSVTTDPTDQNVCAGASVSFTSASSGFPTPTVQWQVSTDGGANFSNITGATSTTLTFNTTASQNGNQYRAVFTNPQGTATSNAATLTVNTPPSVTTNPVDQTACEGASVSFTAASNGSPAPSVQWQVSTNGGGLFTNITGATSTTLTFNAAASQNGNQYRAVFNNVCNSATTTTATLTVNAAPNVTTNPVNQTACEGASVSFTAASNGSPAPTVQWQVSTDGGANFSNITGATSTTLAFTSTTSQNGNQYRAVFANLCSTATTNAATLTVNQNTTATTPGDQTVCQGATANFSTTASGTSISYQWKLDGNNIAGATGSSVAINTTSLSVGNHTVDVIVSGVCGTITRTASLAVQENTSATTPGDQTVCQGASASFSTTASGTGPLHYAWTVDGSSFGGDTSSISVPTGSLSVGAHPVAVTVSGACGSVTRNATLTVHENTSATTPGDQTVCQGASASFSTTASGTGPFHYAWTLDGSPFNGDSASISVPTGSLSVGAHPVAVTVSGACGSVTRNATLTVHENTSATTPGDQTVCQGATANFSTTASGTSISYQWKLDGNNIAGATGSSVAINTASLSAGNHAVDVVVTGECGVLTRSATLTVNTAPVVTTNPASQTVISGNATFTAAASGSPAPTVQWQVSTNGGASFSNIPGANSTTLTFATNSSQNGNQYRAVFTNGCGTATTTAATLTTCTPPVVTANPTSVADACVGQTINFTASAGGTPAPTVQWQVSTNGGASFSNIPGATSNTLSITASVAVRNNQYRAVFTNACGTENSNAATLGVDTIAPVITLSHQTLSLWPPNHKYATFNISNFVSGATDNCNANLLSSVVIASVTSDELEDNPNGGDGDTLNDIVIASDCKSVQLRAERDGNLNGRVYTITFRVRDSAGNVGTSTATVTVPHDQGNGAAVNDGPHYTVTGTCP